MALSGYKNTASDPLKESLPLIRQLGSYSRRLEQAKDLDPLMERIGDARYVLLGEASHGTSEYYLWRQILTRRLIKEKGFSFIAVEGDWPDCYRINQYVKGEKEGGESAYKILFGFSRWPTWMWANYEIVHLAEWLRRQNNFLPENRKIGFYGLDVYSLWESMEEVIRYLDQYNPSAAQLAKQAYGCFEPYAGEVESYARAAAFVPDSCEEEVVAALSLLRRSAPDLSVSREAEFNAEQNAEIVRNAERYYRTMIFGGATSWNIRDFHMANTLERLMTFLGKDAKAIVWEHNSHIGDARATDMEDAGMINVGQIVRERSGRDNTVLVGFGSYQGSVVAAREWGAPMEIMAVPEARAGSIEQAFHRIDGKNKLLISEDWKGDAGEIELARGHRAIGVVYHPDRERFGNYVRTRLLDRYDAFLYLDRTRSLHPLHIDVSGAEVPETYPFAV